MTASTASSSGCWALHRRGRAPWRGPARWPAGPRPPLAGAGAAGEELRTASPRAARRRTAPRFRPRPGRSPRVAPRRTGVDSAVAVDQHPGPASASGHRGTVSSAFAGLDELQRRPDGVAVVALRRRPSVHHAELDHHGAESFLSSCIASRAFAQVHALVRAQLRVLFAKPSRSVEVAGCHDVDPGRSIPSSPRVRGHPPRGPGAVSSQTSAAVQVPAARGA